MRKRPSRTPTYNTWAGVVARCTDPNEPKYPKYGGRGIKMCDRWRRSFAAFLADMGERPEGKSLDRIDNDGHYEPGNCRWATAGEQTNNRSTTVRVTIGGRTLSLSEWADVSGISHATLAKRLSRGCPAERLLDPLAPPRSGESVNTAKLTPEKVAEVRRRVATGESQTSVAAAFGVSQASVSAIKRGESWRGVGVDEEGGR